MQRSGCQLDFHFHFLQFLAIAINSAEVMEFAAGGGVAGAARSVQATHGTAVRGVEGYDEAGEDVKAVEARRVPSFAAELRPKRIAALAHTLRNAVVSSVAHTVAAVVAQ